jgi:hypothetical protein
VCARFIYDIAHRFQLKFGIGGCDARQMSNSNLQESTQTLSLLAISFYKALLPLLWFHRSQTLNFFFSKPPIQWVPRALSLGVKRPGREADHSPPSSAEVKEWVEQYLHSPNTRPWRGAQLKHRDNFTDCRLTWHQKINTLFSCFIWYKSRGSSVGIVNGYRMEDRGSGFDSWCVLGIFLLSTPSRPALGPIRPPI